MNKLPLTNIEDDQNLHMFLIAKESGIKLPDLYKLTINDLMSIQVSLNKVAEANKKAIKSR